MFEGLDDPAKLTAARKLFERSLNVWDPWFKNMIQDFRFHSGGERQWDPADVQGLRERRRAVLSFNLMQAVIREIIGAQEDAKKEARAMPVGVEDTFRADIFNRLYKAIRRKTDADFADLETFEKGIIGGIAYTIHDLNPMAGEPQWADFVIDPVNPMEVLVDPGAQRRDLRDAQYIIMNRWLGENEFRSQYPKHAGKALEVFGPSDQIEGNFTVKEIPENSINAPAMVTTNFDLPAASEDALYFDRKQRRVRLIHIEYRQHVQRSYVVNPQTGRSERISDRNRMIFERFAPMLSFGQTWEEEVRWLEVVGNHVLFDDVAPVPTRGFSLKAFVCDRDHLNGEPRGLLRDLIDPQREINKRHSQTLDLLNSQVAPGLFAEEGAFVNKAQAESSIREPASITWLTQGAVAGSKFIKRDIPDFPAASAEMMERAVQMFFRIAGINIDTLIGDHSANEPATTALLRYRKSILGITKHILNWHAYQRSCLEAVIDIITSGIIPDAQLEAMLGDPKLRVLDGVVVNAETQEQASIRGLGALEWDVDLDVSSANTTISLLQLRVMLEMAQLQIPIDPEVLVEQLPLPADKRNRLVAYVKAVQQSQSQAGQTQVQLEAAKLQQELAFKSAEAEQGAVEQQEKTRHNMTLEFLQQIRSQRDFIAALAATMEKADAGEKKAMLDLLGRLLDFSVNSQPQAAIAA